jgi:hypothetical protein
MLDLRSHATMQKLFLKQYAAFLNLIFYYAKTTQEIKILRRINHVGEVSEYSPADIRHFPISSDRTL